MDKRTKTEESGVDEHRALEAHLNKIEKVLFSVLEQVVGPIESAEEGGGEHPTKEEFEQEFARLIDEQGCAYVGSVLVDDYEFVDDDFIVFTRAGKKVTGASLGTLGHATALVPEGMNRETFEKQWNSVSSRPVAVCGDDFTIACDDYQVAGQLVYLWEETDYWMSSVRLSAIKEVRGYGEIEDEDNAEP